MRDFIPILKVIIKCAFFSKVRDWSSHLPSELHLPSDGRSSHLLPIFLIPGDSQGPSQVSSWTSSGAYCPDRLEEGRGPEDPHPLQLAVLQPPEVPPLLLHQPLDGHAAGQPHRPTHPPLPGVGHALPLLGPRHPRLRPDVTGPHLGLLLPRLLLLPAGEHPLHSRGDLTQLVQCVCSHKSIPRTQSRRKKRTRERPKCPNRKVQLDPKSPGSQTLSSRYIILQLNRPINDIRPGVKWRPLDYERASQTV